MPRGPAAGMTATVSRTDTSVPTMTAASDFTAASYPTITFAVDKSLSAAWLPDGALTTYAGATQTWHPGDKITRVRVLMGPGLEEVAGLIGTVEITETEGTPIQTASFTIVDTRAAYMDPASWAYGGQYVEVWVSCGTPAGREDVCLFQGYTEASSNEDPYVPKATFRASSLSRAWGERGGNAGCIRVPPFSGYSRMELLQSYAIQTCTPLTTYTGPTGSIVFQGVDIQGLSLIDLAQRWAEVEGYYVRETSGTLELVPETSVLGSSATSVYDFDEDNYLSVREDPPNRPVTTVVISALLPDLDAIDAGPSTETDTAEGTDSEGYSWRVITTRTIDDGVLLRTVVESYSTRAPYGWPTSWLWLGLGLVGRVTTVNTYTQVSVPVEAKAALTFEEAISGDWTEAASGKWLRYESRNTAQLLTTTVTTEGYYAPIADIATGTAWSDGSHHTSAETSWLTTSIISTVQTWRASSTSADACSLATRTVTKQAYGSKADASVSIWDNGEYRSGIVGLANPYEEFGTTETVAERYWDNSADTARTDYRTYYEVRKSGWRLSGYEDIGGGVLKPNEAFGDIEVTRTERVAMSGDRYRETTSKRTLSSYEQDDRIVTGTMPDIPQSSPSVPQHAMRAATATLSALTDVYVDVRKSESNPYAETEEEIVRVAKRLLRDSLAVKEVVASPMIPLLRVFNPVTITDPCRQLDGTQGYVSEIRRTADVLNGWLGQETTIKLPPPELLP